jgi:putative ATPase
MAVQCPVCGRQALTATINDHIDSGCTRGAISFETASPAHSMPSEKSLATMPKQHLGKRARDADTSGPSTTAKSSSAFTFRPPTVSATDNEAKSTSKKVDLPLAERLRPRTLDDLVGQPELVGSGRLLRQLIQNDRIP